jgi:anti-anti-sigma regulatory factor
MEQLMLSAVCARWRDGVLAASAVAGHSRIVLDLERLVFCDASGLRVLIRAQDRAAALGGGCVWRV